MLFHKMSQFELSKHPLVKKKILKFANVPTSKCTVILPTADSFDGRRTANLPTLSCYPTACLPHAAFSNKLLSEHEY